MSHRRSPSTGVRFFRPNLECLEGRNLLSNAGYVNLVASLIPDVRAAANQFSALEDTVNRDVAAYKAAPNNFGNVANLIVHTFSLLEQYSQLASQVNMFSTLVTYGELTGLITGDPLPTTFPQGGAPSNTPLLDNKTFDGLESIFLGTISDAQSNVAVAEADMLGTLFAFLSGTSGHLLFLPSNNPSPAPPPPTQPTPLAFSENITPAPSVFPGNGGNVEEQVTYTNPFNTLATVAIGYVATDGRTASVTDNCTDSTITVPLSVPASAAGVTGTWTVTATGEPTQTNTTLYT